MLLGLPLTNLLKAENWYHPYFFLVLGPHFMPYLKGQLHGHVTGAITQDPVLRKVSYLGFSSVQFSHSVVSDSLQPHESQHTCLPVHQQLLEFTQTYVHQIGDAIQLSHPLLSPSPAAPNPSQHKGLIQ